MMKNRTLFTIIPYILASVLCILCVIFIIRQEPRCYYSNYVRLDNSSYTEVDKDDFYFEVGAENIDNNTEPFCLIKVSGICYELKGDSYVNGLILYNEQNQYSIKTVNAEVKNDIPTSYYCSENNKLVFNAYIPRDSIDNGSYEIGLLISGQQGQRIIKTGQILDTNLHE